MQTRAPRSRSSGRRILVGRINQNETETYPLCILDRGNRLRRAGRARVERITAGQLSASKADARSEHRADARRGAEQAAAAARSIASASERNDCAGAAASCRRGEHRHRFCAAVPGDDTRHHESVVRRCQWQAHFCLRRRAARQSRHKLARVAGRRHRRRSDAGGRRTAGRRHVSRARQNRTAAYRRRERGATRAAIGWRRDALL